MKKVYFVFFMIITCIQIIPAQATDLKNWVSGEAGLFGLSIRYERILNRNFSVGALLSANFNYFGLFDYGIQTTLRWYPWGGRFFSELGIGFGHIDVFHDHYDYYHYDFGYIEECTYSEINGLRLSPTIGWKFDVGKPGGFFISPMVSIPLVIGRKVYGDNEKEDFTVMPTFRIAALGFGFSFK